MAVLPLVGRLRLDTTCLVIGAMSPDFEYFARIKQQSDISHTWLGLVVFDLPATLLLAALFHFVVKWPAVLVAPRFVARRASVFAARPWGELSLGFALSCVISSLIGALTHLLWDGVTHSDGVFVARFKSLRTLVDVPGLASDMALHRVFQHASTVLGLFVCAIYVAVVLRRTPAIELPARPRVWPRLVAAAAITAGAAGAVFTMITAHRWPDIGNRVVVAIAGALIGGLVASVVLRRAAYRARVESPP